MNRRARTSRAAAPTPKRHSCRGGGLDRAGAARPATLAAPPAAPGGRRDFLKRVAGAAAAVAGIRLLPRRLWAGEAPGILPVKNPNSKLQLAVVGLGGIAGGHLMAASGDENLA